MDLTADNVHTIFLDCLFKDDEIPSDGSHPPNMAVAEGVMHKCGFHAGRLQGHKQDVVSLLDQLPDAFHEKSGGGMSFLNACMTRGETFDGHQAEGRQWGEHVNIEELLCLGLALGIAEYNMPRDKWKYLPGGMPYFVVKSTP